MVDNLILQGRDKNILTVTVNRPHKANSLTNEMLEELVVIFKEAAADDNLLGVVVTGAGDRVFCAGADLSELVTGGDDTPDEWSRMAESLRKIPVMTVALLNGHCMGGGLSLALGCDIRVSVSKARFAYPVFKNNVLPGQYDVNSLCSLIGKGRTSIILLGGQTIDADEALQWGLVDRIIDFSEFDYEYEKLFKIAKSSDRNHQIKIKARIKVSE